MVKIRNIKSFFYYFCKNILYRKNLVYIEHNLIELSHIEELKKVFNLSSSGELARDDIYDYSCVLDLNQRRIRDAEVLSTIAKACDGKTIVEIGTETGMGTALISHNAPHSNIYTVNIAPEEITRGEGGIYTTSNLSKDQIGYAYRDKGCQNITQIFANTKHWDPSDLGPVSMAFIDGCHDTNFVINDTLKMIKLMPPGSYIVWHDFNIALRKPFPWINEVCFAIEKLYRMGVLHNRIYHVKDSWMAVYRV